MKNQTKIAFFFAASMLLAACGPSASSSSSAPEVSSSSPTPSQTSETPASSSEVPAGESSTQAPDTSVPTPDTSTPTPDTSTPVQDSSAPVQDSSEATPTKPFHTWQLIGSAEDIGEWTFEKAPSFVYDAATDVHSITVTMYRGTQFKAVADKTWSDATEVYTQIIDSFNNADILAAQGRNVQVKKSGEFVITIKDVESVTAADVSVAYTEVEDPVVKPLHQWAVVGQQNGWDPAKGIAFTYNEATDTHTLEIDAVKGDSFKIVADFKWGIEIGTGLVTAANDSSLLVVEGNDKNAQFQKYGKCTITIKDDIDVTAADNGASSISVSFQETQLSRWYVVGIFDGKSVWDAYQTSLIFSYDAETKIHTLQREFKTGDAVRFLADRSWNTAYGKVFAEKFNDSAYLGFSNDGNLEFKADGKYTFTIADNALTLTDPTSAMTVSLEGYVPTPVEEKANHYYSLVGQPNNWDNNHGVEFTYDKETKTHTLAYDALKGDMFKVLADKSWDMKLGKVLVEAANDLDILVSEGAENDLKAMFVKNGKYTFTIKDTEGLPTKEDITITCSPAGSVTNWTALGDFKEPKWNFAGGQVGVYDATTREHKITMKLYAGNELKIYANRSWANEFGGVFVDKLGDETKLKKGEGEKPNIVVVESGIYNFIIKDDALALDNILNGITVTFETPEYVDVYFGDHTQWASDGAATYAYIFTTGHELKAWPGVPCDKVGTVDGHAIWHITVNYSLYDKVVFTRTSPEGVYWDARTPDLDLAQFDAKTPLYDISEAEQVFGGNANGKWEEYTPEPATPTATLAPVLERGNAATRIEGAGIHIFLDNAKLGLNGESAGVAKDTIEASIVDMASVTFSEKFFSDFDEGTHSVRLFLVANRGLDQGEVVVNFSFSVGETKYAASVSFNNGAFVSAGAVVVPEETPSTPEGSAVTILQRGNAATRIEGAGIHIFLDNAKLGLTGESAGVAKDTIEASVVGNADITFSEKFFSDFDEGTHSVRLFLVANRGLDQGDYTVSFSFSIGEIKYAGTASFTNGAYNVPNA